MAQAIKKRSYEVGDYVIEFRNPSIKRHFWFAEDARTVEEWDEVQSRVDAASKSERYFIESNIADLEATRLLKNADDWRFKMYVYEGKHFVDCVWNDGEPSYSWDNPHLLTDEEKEQLKDACKREQELFTKRLKTYLKRYGLSKCTFDSYWSER